MSTDNISKSESKKSKMEVINWFLRLFYVNDDNDLELPILGNPNFFRQLAGMLNIKKRGNFIFDNAKT